MRLLSLFSIVTAFTLHSAIRAADEIPPIKRILPPPGIKIPDEDGRRLQEGIHQLDAGIERALGISGRLASADVVLPDVQVYLKAVRYGLENDEFYDRKDTQRAFALLRIGEKRLDELKAVLLEPDRNALSWLHETGPVVLGYRSSIDDSVQPFGLDIPPNLAELKKPIPLYVWLHGRGDKMTEMAFIAGMKPPPINPPDAFVLQPYGRYMNGFKFAGEDDVIRAIGAVASSRYCYLVDWERIVLCGFSMGGAGAWHLGAHYPNWWAAVSPGAGFAETAQYQRLTPDKYPPWYEQALWGLYDVPDYVRNLFNTSVIAYSGEVDKQIQAARVMEAAYQREGRTLEHLIGPGMGHKYHPDVLKQLQARLAEFAAKGKPRDPDVVTLQTRTLRYGSSPYVTLVQLKEHWKDTRLTYFRRESRIETTNVVRFWIADLASNDPTTLTIDGQRVETKVKDSFDHVIGTNLLLRDGRWEVIDPAQVEVGLHKTMGLQGPIDEAFCDRFVVVTPSGRSSNPKFERWMRFELAHFLDRWRRLFRGDAIVVSDQEFDLAQADSSVILWGDFESNQALAKLKGKLPLTWTRDKLTVNGHEYAAANHAPVMIYPNPLAHGQYVVLNSGFTFREGHDSSNSLQTPKLPDWAVVDLDTLPDAYAPGKIAAAGFFDEQWQYRQQDGPAQPMK